MWEGTSSLRPGHRAEGEGVGGTTGRRPPLTWGGESWHTLPEGVCMWHKQKVNRLTSMCPNQPPLLMPSTTVNFAFTTSLVFLKDLRYFYRNNMLMEKADL